MYHEIRSSNTPSFTLTLDERYRKSEFYKHLSLKAPNEIHFITDCHYFLKEPSGSSKQEYAQQIYRKYLAVDASFPIGHINGVEIKKRKVTQIIDESLQSKMNVPSNLFQELRQVVAASISPDRYTHHYKSLIYLMLHNYFEKNRDLELPEEIWRNFRRACEGSTEDGWAHLGHKKGVQVYKKKFEGWNGICVRGSLVVPISLEEMYQIASRLDVRPHWDSGIKPSMVESLTDVCYIARYVFKPPKIAFMADAHEFITMRAEQWEPDGSCMILQCSIEHPDYVNVKKGHKRSELDLGGFHITKVSDKSCVITYVNQTDLKDIPKSITEILVMKRAMRPRNIDSYISKERTAAAKEKRKPIWQSNVLRSSSSSSDSFGSSIFSDGILSDVTLSDKLGGGTFGDVFYGTWKSSAVAIKVLKNIEQQNVDFIKEVALIKQLNHPNIIRYFGMYLDYREQTRGIVMEYMSEGSLLHYVIREASNLKPVDLLLMAKDIAAGLQYLEEKKIVHRDIALRNILINDKKELLILPRDFGLSGSMNGEILDIDDSKIPVRWTAPEGVKYKKFSIYSDIWSFGVLLYELFSYGGKPYEEMTTSQVIEFIDSGKRLGCPKECPATLYNIMTQCWNYNPEERLQSFTVIYHVIQQLLVNLKEKSNGEKSPLIDLTVSSEQEYVTTPFSVWNSQ